VAVNPLCWPSRLHFNSGRREIRFMAKVR
jgi:hypothetical protein